MKYNVHMLAFNNGIIRQVEVPDEEITTNTFADLEQIFYWGQNESQPQKICSVSAGDVIEYQNKLFAVILTGFKELTPKQFEDYKKSNDSLRFISFYNLIKNDNELSEDEYYNKIAEENDEVLDINDRHFLEGTK